jgi:hypothetical protein
LRRECLQKTIIEGKINGKRKKEIQNIDRLDERKNIC